MVLRDAIYRIRRLKVARTAAMEVLEGAGREVLDVMKVRIFRDGKAADGSQISPAYSTGHKLYQRKDFINPSAFKGRGQFMFVRGGYREFRAIQGLQIAFVNLVYSGELREHTVVAADGSKIGLGFSSVDASEKARKNEAHFKKRIFTLSVAEKLLLKNRIVEGIKRLQK